jgi:SAM-dependent methyltransferase
MQTLADQTYWDQSYERYEFRPAPDDNMLLRWIRQSLPPGTGACLEVGCFPGRFLPILGELGYELHGIDLTPRVEQDLPAWLRNQGYRVGRFVKGEFLSWDPGRRYDVVCSFGFIEHFSDWPAVLRSQARLVAKGGYLVVSTPNFRGALQWLLHWSLDRQNLKRHNIWSMNPRLIFRPKSEFDHNILCWSDDRYTRRIGKIAFHAVSR